MSILNSDPWFGRGATFGATSTDIGANVVGSEKVFTDAHPRTGIVNSNVPVKCVAARNSSGSAILPGTCVKFKSSDLLGAVDGSAGVNDLVVGVADEYLPASGVAANDIFWVVVNGPTTANTAATFAAGDTISFTGGAAVAAVANKTAGVAIAATSSGTVRVLLGLGSRSARCSAP